MATKLPGYQTKICRSPKNKTLPRNRLLLLFITLFPAISHAQLQQPFVYTTAGAIATRDDLSGVLAPTSSSPLPPLGFPVVIDAKARFLFAAGNNSIHMFSVDAATGAYIEVPNSPFASAATNTPILIATEPSGTFLAVVNATGLNLGESSLESFLIDSASQTLIPVPGSFLELASSPVGAAANPTLGTFYVYLGPNPSSSNPFLQQDGDLIVYTIDPQTGFLGNDTGAAGSTNFGRAFGADPLGRFVITCAGHLDGSMLVTAASGANGLLALGSGIFPAEIFVGPGQRFIYATIFGGLISFVHIYTVDAATWTLSESPSSPLPNFSSVGSFVADPTGPFVYKSSTAGQISVYQVDPQTGYFTEIPNSPFSSPGYGPPIAFSIANGSIQPVGGPVATLSPTVLSLGSIPVGSPSPAQSITLSNTGDQALSINAISVAGPSAANFTESDTCSPPTGLAAAHSCSISVIFTPVAAGPNQAQLLITDNAPASPQSVPLSGTGTAPPPPAPAITFIPGTLNFPSLSQGSTSPPLTLSVINSGNAPLNISSLLLNGNNPADFNNPSGNCVGVPIAPTTSCSLTATFTPQASGLRQATFTFIDDAPGSPHFIILAGTGIVAPPVPAPVTKLTPTTLTFPTITQGLASTPLTVTITNSGTAPLHISAISAGGSSPIDFINSFTSCATATIAASAACNITVVFSPLFSGPRSETISVADDSPNSPHVLNVFANATPAFTLTSAPAALSASVTAGQTASYNLQLTPGTDFSGSVSFACTGAPLGATCKLPPAVTLNVGAPATLTITVPTSNGAATVSQFPQNFTRITERFTPGFRRTLPPDPAPEILFTIICLFFIYVARLPAARTISRHISSLQMLRASPRRGFSPEVARSDPKPFSRSLTSNLHHPRGKLLCSLTAFAVFLVIAGCGGGSTPPASQGGSTVTPRGTSNLLLTPTVLGVSGKPLQLPPIQLTLTVK